MQPKDYLSILNGISDLPFPVGKKLLIAYLRGGDHESIKRNRLDRLGSFGCLLYSEREIEEEIRWLEQNGLIDYTGMRSNVFVKVIVLTPKGMKERSDPSLFSLKMGGRSQEYHYEITPEERMVFKSLGFFLDRYNDLQKKAIIADSKNILCIAGAGTGKTTVLTTRVQFLNRFRSVEGKRILAITFTRKARQEMINRLSGHVRGVHIETFNSFCERYLNAYGDLIYGRRVRVITMRERIAIMRKGLNALGTSLEKAITTYFSDQQMRLKTPDQLMFTLLNDCFSIIDLYKVEGKEIKDIPCARSERASVDLILGLARFITAAMRKAGLRDFTDQLIDCYQFFSGHPHAIPRFDHVLVDEYQDVNAMQIQLLGLLEPKYLFAVGDPRQSIFGWRGSKISYILDFSSRHENAEVIPLVVNYRSSERLVRLANASLRKLCLPDLTAHSKEDSTITMIQADDEVTERQEILRAIQNKGYKMEDIFVLARTNRQLNPLSLLLNASGVPHIVKTDEERTPATPLEGAVTLATIHAIKGLEAEFVIIMGATTAYFPCKASDHPILDLLKDQHYDREEEERRLLYVAITRARKELLITYAGKAMSWYITDEMKQMIELDGAIQGETELRATGDPFTNLRMWRAKRARELGVPAYFIMNDATMREIIEKMPVSTLDLEAVKGMGKEKVRRYGNEIISMLN